MGTVPRQFQYGFHHRKSEDYFLILFLTKAHASLHLIIFEPPHDKTSKMNMRPAKTQISLGIRPVWSESSQCAQWVAKDPRFLHADSEDSDQTLNPRLWCPDYDGRTCHFVDFVMRGLICAGMITSDWLLRLGFFLRKQIQCTVKQMWVFDDN